MKLSVLERILLGNLLASQEGNFATLKLVRKAREALSFNDEENKKLGFVQDGQQLKWGLDAAIELAEVEIGFSDTVNLLIRKILKDLNDQAKLTDQHFSLYEKFMEDDESVHAVH